MMKKFLRNMESTDGNEIENNNLTVIFIAKSNSDFDIQTLEN